MPSEEIRKLLQEKRPILRDEAISALTHAVSDIERMLRFASEENGFPELRRLMKSYLSQIEEAEKLDADEEVEIDLFALHFER